ncbi:RICIN domain-containing protein [Kitasatospora sp. NPDC088783]|uniref:RICIN domain-containing protein n=1 Tax=Kitasatospora sp. NPDC088783 TaxID=3364077 RepID=UPI00381C9878
MLTPTTRPEETTVTDSPRRTPRSTSRTARVLCAAAVAAAALVAAPSSASASSDPTRDGWACAPGYYRINTSGGMVFDLSQGPDSKGAIVQYQYQGLANQQWRVCHWGADTTSTTPYIFKNRMNGRCITIWDKSTSDGSWFIEGDCNGWIYDDQKFWLDYLPGTSTFALQVLSSSSWVSVDQGLYSVSRARLVQYADHAGVFSLSPA